MERSRLACVIDAAPSKTRYVVSLFCWTSNQDITGAKAEIGLREETWRHLASPRSRARIL
jgi:hypothetical protein